MGADWRDSQIRYLVHFEDGGSGMRHRAEPLTIGDDLDDGGGRYRVERVEPPPNPNAFGHAWVPRISQRIQFSAGRTVVRRAASRRP